MRQADLAIIGGGIVGLSVAHAAGLRFPEQQVIVLEKEDRVAAHQSGRNSGVLHSGLYYRPGSLKARYCREGRRAMLAFCRDEGIDVERRGKVIVAVEQRELPMLQRLVEQGRANAVEVETIGPQRLRELEPGTRGLRAAHVPGVEVLEFAQVCRRLARIVEARRGRVVTGARVTAIERVDGRVRMQTTAGPVDCRVAINCAGLHSDRVTRLAGDRPTARIVPFRGEYRRLRPEAAQLCRGLIYPVPDPRYPFLGVHFTRGVDGSVECGPNAVLALCREGYRRSDVSLRDVWDALAYRGFVRLALRHWRTGCGEIRRSLRPAAFLRSARRLIPELVPADLEPAPSGVRAQAIDVRGTLLDDFVFDEGREILHVVNAPSPAATAAFAIGSAVVERVAQRLEA